MKNQRRVFSIAGLIVVLGLIAALGYRYWYQPSYDFFNTDDAQVTGALVHVAAPASGQVNDLYFDVGSTVKQNNVLATVKVVSPVASTVPGPSVARVLARVTSPVDGTVATRDVSVGDTVAAGQSLATIVDLSQLWVVVNVDEGRATDIHVGQTADVALTATSQVFRSKVAEIGSATTAITAAPVIGGLTSSSSSSDTTKKVPVKVVFDYSGYRLVPGMSATVTIYTSVAPQ